MTNRPIGQAFFVDLPDSGVKGVYVRQVGVYFRSKSATAGIKLEIRETENGVPTPRVITFGKARLNAANVNTSTNGSTETKFTFETPVWLNAGESYAIVLIPEGVSTGDPNLVNSDYTVFTSELSGENTNDLYTGNPVTVNDPVGTLFISANDIQWTAIQNEDMKFNIYIANFTANSGTAYWTNPDEDYLHIKDLTGNFSPEKVFLSNNRFDLAKLDISSTSGTWTTNEWVYQSNGSANTAGGYVYSGNSTVLLVQNVTGAFVTTNTVTGNSSGTTATIDSANQTIVTSSSNNYIAMPFTDLVTNGIYYIAENNFGTTKIVAANTAASNSTHVFTYGIKMLSSSNAVFVANTSETDHITFSDTAGVMGQVRGNGALYASISTVIQYHAEDYYRTIIDSVTSDDLSVTSFANSAGQRLIGRASGESANVIDTFNPFYNSLTPQFETFNPDKTLLEYSIKTVKNDASFTESDWTTVSPGNATEFISQEKSILSRSNEYQDLPILRSGNSTCTFRVSLTSEDSKISPAIDRARTNVTFAYNVVPLENELEGYYITLSNTSGDFTVGETVTIGSSESATLNAAAVSANGFIPISSNPYAVNDYVNYLVAEGNTAITELVDGYNYYVSQSNSTGIYLAETEGGADITLTAGSSETGHSIVSVNLTGNVVFANSSFMNIKTPVGNGLVNRTVTGGSSSSTSTARRIEYYDESLDNGYYRVSRYISKSVILADNQDAEDLRVYITAYRPVNTNVMMYAKFRHKDDPDTFENKSWTKLNELNIPFFSATSNINDRIEIEYGVPASSVYQSTNATCNTTSLICTLEATEGLANNTICYITDIASDRMMIREIVHVVNNTTVILDAIPGFASTNAAFGTISGLNSKESAFIYTENNNIIRYVDGNDAVFDSYKDFAIKIVPVSNNSYTIPRIADMRALALQV